MKIKDIIKEIRGVFQLPIRKFYIGKIKYYTPYFLPMNFNANIIKIIRLKKSELTKSNNIWINNNRDKWKNYPILKRSKNWTVNLLGKHYYIEIGWPINWTVLELGWKDKFNSPRFEWSPAKILFLFKWQIAVVWESPYEEIDEYWEQILWYIIYSNRNIEIAEKTWDCYDINTGESTWQKFKKIKK